MGGGEVVREGPGGGVSAACACLTQQTRVAAAAADPGAPLVSCSVSLTQELGCTCEGEMQPCRLCTPPPIPLQSLTQPAQFAFLRPSDGETPATASTQQREIKSSSQLVNPMLMMQVVDVLFGAHHHCKDKEQKCGATTTTATSTGKAQKKLT